MDRVFAFEEKERTRLEGWGEAKEGVCGRKGRVGGQGEREGAAFVDLAVDAKGSMMSAQDAEDNAKTHPASGEAGGVEGFKELFLVIGVDAFALILDGEADDLLGRVVGFFVGFPDLRMEGLRAKM